MPMHADSDIAVGAYNKTNSSNYYILGANDGSVRVHNAADFGKSFSLNVHDNNYGQVSHVAVSFDDSHVLSIGRDGNFFVFQAAYDGELIEVRSPIVSMVSSSSSNHLIIHSHWPSVATHFNIIMH